MAFITLSEKISVELPPERVLIAAVVCECWQFLSVECCCPYRVSFATFSYTSRSSDLICGIVSISLKDVALWSSARVIVGRLVRRQERI